MKTHKGLENNGATCYMNSILQALFHSKLFKSSLTIVPQDKAKIEELIVNPPKEKMEKTPSSTISSLQALFIIMEKSIAQAIKTEGFCHGIGMSKQDMVIQEDANELFKKIIDYIDQCCVSRDKYIQEQLSVDPNNQELINEIEILQQHLSFFNIQHTETDGLYKRLFQEFYEGQQQTKIVCYNCSNVSQHSLPFTDLMMPIKQDCFECLASMLMPEIIDEYKCEKCMKKNKAIKFIKINTIALQSVMSLQRFSYDMYSDQYQKDSHQVSFPVALDFYFLGQIDYLNFCNNKNLNPDQKKQDRIVEYLKLTMMPWQYFSINNNGDLAIKVQVQSETVKQLLLSNQELKNYIQKFYNKDVKPLYNCKETDTNKDYTYYSVPLVQSNNISPTLYIMSSIVCHLGTINSGHYFTLFNQFKNNQFDNLNQVHAVLHEANDDAMQQINKPINMLEFIAGKTDTLDNNPNSPKSRNTLMQSFGNTGYMYFYENFNVMLKFMQLDQSKYQITSEKIELFLNNQNEIEIEKMSKCTMQIFTNILNSNDLKPSTCYCPENQDTQLQNVVIQFDTRKSFKDLLDEYLKKVNIDFHQFEQIQVHQISLNFNNNIPSHFKNSIDRMKLCDNLEDAINKVIQNYPQKIQLFIQFPCQQQYDFDPETKNILIQQIQFNEKLDIIEKLDQMKVIQFNKNQTNQLKQQLYQPINQNEITLADVKTAISDNINQSSDFKIHAQFAQKSLIYLQNHSTNEFHVYNGNNSQNLLQSDCDEQMPVENGFIFFFELLEQNLSSLIVPLIIQQQQKSNQNQLQFQIKTELINVSKIFRYQQDLLQGYQIFYIIDNEDNEDNVQNRQKLRKQDNSIKILQKCEQLAGTSDLGFKVDLVIQQQSSNKMQYKSLLTFYEVNKNSAYIAFPVEKLYQKMLEYKTRFDQIVNQQIIVKISYIKTEQPYSLTFILNKFNSSYCYFNLANNQTVFNDNDTVEQVWNKYSQQGATINQFKKDNLTISTPAQDLRFYYLNQQQAIQHNNEQKMHLLFNNKSALKLSTALNFKLFKNQFYIYVDIKNQYEKMFEEQFPVVNQFRMKAIQLKWDDTNFQIIKVPIQPKMHIKSLREFCHRILQDQFTGIYVLHNKVQKSIPEELDLYELDQVEMFVAE